MMRELDQMAIQEEMTVINTLARVITNEFTLFHSLDLRPRAIELLSAADERPDTSEVRRFRIHRVSVPFCEGVWRLEPGPPPELFNPRPE